MLDCNERLCEDILDAMGVGVEYRVRNVIQALVGRGQHTAITPSRIRFWLDHLVSEGKLATMHRGKNVIFIKMGDLKC